MGAPIGGGSATKIDSAAAQNLVSPSRMPSLSYFYHTLKNYDDSKWWLPTDEFFWQDEGYDVKEEYDELKRIVAKGCPPTELTGDAHHKALNEHATKIQLLKQRLAILTEQEKPQSIEEEERKLRYWMDGLERHQNDDAGEKDLLINLQQIEDNYRKAKATVEARLATYRERRLEKEAYWKKGVRNAQDHLNGMKAFRSKPRIKLEMELEPHQKFVNDYYAELRAFTAHSEAEDKLKVLEAKVWQRKVDWFKVKAAEWNAEQDQAERERAYRATLPPPELKPTPKPTTIVSTKMVRKTVKVVDRPPTPEEIVRGVLETIIDQALSLAQQTQSSPSGLEGCNSGAASPDARRELMAGDPQ